MSKSTKWPFFLGVCLSRWTIANITIIPAPKDFQSAEISNLVRTYESNYYICVTIIIMTKSSSKRYIKPEVDAICAGISYALLSDSLIGIDSDDIVAPGFDNEDWI